MWSTLRWIYRAFKGIVCLLLVDSVEICGKLQQIKLHHQFIAPHLVTCITGKQQMDCHYAAL